MIPIPSLLAIICASLFLLASGSTEEAERREFGTRGDMVFSGFLMNEPFASDELKTLAENASRDYDDDRRLMSLILRAGIERKPEFAYLLEEKDLRKIASIDLALSAYDFTINREESALDHILAILATEDIGADADAIVILSALDEWDRSIRAYRKHFAHTDGAGASAMYGFMATRAYLFPRNYEKYREVIEAPIVWQRSLIPKSQAKAEQNGADQPATAVDSESEGKEKTEPESEGRSQ